MSASTSFTAPRTAKHRTANGGAPTNFAFTQHTLRDGAKEKHRHGS